LTKFYNSIITNHNQLSRINSGSKDYLKPSARGEIRSLINKNFKQLCSLMGQGASCPVL